jgi:uncharacterized protein YfaS (alpha-2-macroglobulin family)
MSGQLAQLNAVKQNDRFIVHVFGEMTDNRARLMALLDLLPSGFEIEGVVQRKEDGSTIYPFLPVLAVSNVAEARDDRFVATFDIGSSYQPTDPKEIAKQRRPTFHFAYIVRATVPGSYVVPAAVVEDMYAPDVRARTGMVAVVDSGSLRLFGEPLWPVFIEGEPTDDRISLDLLRGPAAGPEVDAFLQFLQGAEGRAFLIDLGYEVP